MNVSVFQEVYLRRIGVSTPMEDINVFVANALRFVVQHVFAHISNDFVFILSSDGGPCEFALNDIMTKLFATWSFMAAQLIFLDKTSKSMDMLGRRYCNMIMIDSFKSLERTKIAEYNENSDGLEYYFIYLQMRDQLLENEMKKIFNYCFNNYWIHCDVMIQNAKGEIYVYTYFPFKENECFNTQPEIINKFMGDHFVNKEIFPEKLRNLNECPLKLTTWNMPPFVINGTDYFHPELGDVAGFEILILHAIREELNFTLNVEVISIDTYKQNQTPSYIPLKMLRERETNITMGYFRRMIIRDQIATPSYVTYYIPLVAVILRRKTRFQSVGVLTFPFDKTTWTLILVIYVIIVIMNFINVRNRVVETFQIHQVFLGMPVGNVPTLTSKRIRLSIMLLSSFVLRSVYQSLLFHLFRTHFYEAPPLTLNGLVENGYKAVCTEMSLSHIENVPQISDKSLPLFVIYSPNEMYPLYFLEVNSDENFVAMSSFEFAIFYAIAILSMENALQLLPINVNEQQIGFYFTKHSYLVDRFDSYILKFHQSGLLRKWKEWYNMEYLVQQESGHSTSYENILIISFNQLMGFFIVILIMHSIAILLFILELLSKKIKWLRKLF